MNGEYIMNKNLKIITLLVVAIPAQSALAWSFSDAYANLKTVATNAYNSEYANNTKSFLADRYERTANSAAVMRDAVIYNEDVVAMTDAAKNMYAKSPHIVEGAKKAYNASIEYVKNTEQVKADAIAIAHKVSEQANNALTATKEVIAQHPTATKIAAGTTVAVVVAGTALAIKSKLNARNEVKAVELRNEKHIVVDAMNVKIDQDILHLALQEKNKDEFRFIESKVGALARVLPNNARVTAVKNAALAFEKAFVSYLTFNEYVAKTVSKETLKANIETAKASLKQAIATYAAADQ